MSRAAKSKGRWVVLLLAALLGGAAVAGASIPPPERWPALLKPTSVGVLEPPGSALTTSQPEPVLAAVASPSAHRFRLFADVAGEQPLFGHPGRPYPALSWPKTRLRASRLADWSQHQENKRLSLEIVEGEGDGPSSYVFAGYSPFNYGDPYGLCLGFRAETCAQLAALLEEEIGRRYPKHPVDGRANQIGFRVMLSPVLGFLRMGAAVETLLSPPPTMRNERDLRAAVNERTLAFVETAADVAVVYGAVRPLAGGVRVAAWAQRGVAAAPTLEREGARSLGEILPRGGCASYGCEFLDDGLRMVGPPLPVAREEGEVFFRTMSREHADKLAVTGRLPATAETFISPTQAFAEGYEGVLVRFEVQPGTTARLVTIGVRDAAPPTAAAYPQMPLVRRGWASTNALFKREGRQINIGLGRGAALDIFNQRIVSYEIIRP